MPLERFAETSARNLVEAIQNSKRITLPRFIYALGIRNVGIETAHDLAEHFGSIEKAQAASQQTLRELKDIGPVGAESIHDWFSQKRNIQFLSKLKKAGVAIKRQEHISLPEKHQKLQGTTFVVTGSLESMTREQAKEKIRALGGIIAESISKRTNYLVVGKAPGSKLTKARKLGVKTIHEKEFLTILE